MNKKRFIAQQSGAQHVKIFNAETGQLTKIIFVGEITSPPICTEREMYVGVRINSSQNAIKYFNVPSFSLNKIVSIGN
jgi:hypothetical protein